MTKKLLVAAFAAITILTANAQTDTTRYYYSMDNRLTTADSAVAVLKMFLKEGKWYGVQFDKKTNRLRSEGFYLTNDPKTPDGAFKNYKEDGSLDYVANWNNGKPLSKEWFYKNGNKKSLVSYNDKKISIEKGWDEDGKEIRNYIVEREARFKGGPEGYKKFLEKHLNANVAANAGAPAGTYEVKLQFVISKEGYVGKVKAVSVPAACKPCAAEAVSVLSSVPAWEPAIQKTMSLLFTRQFNTSLLWWLMMVR